MAKPQGEAATPEDKKWLPKVKKRANATAGDAASSSPGDNSGDGSGSGAGAGGGSSSAGSKRPAAGSSRQPAVKRHDRGGPSSAPSSTTRRASGRGASSQLQRWLMTLPEGPFGQLGLGKVLMRKPTRMVRVASSEASGLWAAVFRLGADSTCTSSVPSTALAMSGMPAVCHQAPPGCGPVLQRILSCTSPCNA